MGLGVVCHWLEARSRPRSGDVIVNAMDERSLQLARWRAGDYSDERIVATYLHNVRSLGRMVPRISALVKCFRVSSSLLHLADQVDPSLYDNAELRAALTTVGQAFRDAGVRVTTHPGQFCVLSSDHDAVVENSRRDLMVHGFVFDAMGLPRSPHAAINIHGGKSGAAQRLIDSIVDLPDEVRTRLTLENDESAYSVVDLLQVHKRTGVPIVLDSHHHTFNDHGVSLELAHRAAIATWPAGVKPLQHVSNTEPGLENGSFMDRRKHSQYLHHVPDIQRASLLDDSIDLEVEAKMKNLAVQRFLEGMKSR